MRAPPTHEAIEGAVPDAAVDRDAGAALEPRPHPAERHRLLRRQLRRHRGVLARDDAELLTFLDAVDAAYHQADYDREMLERALELSSAELLEANQELRTAVFQDALTGLPNRALFRDRLEQAIARAHRHGRQIALLFLDVDRFKRVNDTLGHTAGDQLLVEVGRRLHAAKRAEDTVARVGGDEFVHLVTELHHPEAAARVADRLLHAFDAPFSLDGQLLHVSASVGISLYPHDAHDADALVRHADVALYRAKEHGRSQYRMYTGAMNARAYERLMLENDLRRAIENGELRLVYQPMVDAATGRWTGAEALVRWQRGDRLLLPADFVPAAEDSGLILPLGDWVLATACADLARWRRDGAGPRRVAVNLSARQLRPALVGRLERCLADAGLAPGDLELELTESALLAVPEEAARLLGRLHDLGVAVALDDFGTGHGSLQHLKTLPISALKIDRAFVAGCLVDPKDAAIVTSVLGLARGLGLRTVGEGVETAAQADLLRRAGCDELQGYHFARPEPADAVAARFGRGAGLPEDGAEAV